MIFFKHLEAKLALKYHEILIIFCLQKCFEKYLINFLQPFLAKTDRFCPLKEKQTKKQKTKKQTNRKTKINKQKTKTSDFT